MENFIIAFNAVMPLMIYLIVGRFIMYYGWMSQRSLQELNQLIFRLLLPINLFMNIYQTDLTTSFRMDVFIYAIVMAILIFILFTVIIHFVEKDPAKQGVMLQGAFRSNFVLFGLPIAVSLLNGRDIGMTTILIAVLVPLNNVLSIVALNIYKQRQFDFKELGLSVLKNQMFIATMIGIVFRLIGLTIPVFLEKAMTGLSGSITPLALVIMGATFNISTLNHSIKQLTFTLVSKLIIVPILGIGGALMLGFTGENLIPLIIFFGGPVAVSSYPMAQVMGGDGDLANQAVVFSTFFSMFTLIAWIAIAANLGVL